MIARFETLPHRACATAAIEDIFFAASATADFPSQEARAAFRERWLSRYLERFPSEVFVALSVEGRIIGYLAGCLSDPARNGHFSDISYFGEFKDLTRQYPAHLHINMAPGHRGHGHGAQLIEAFGAHAAAAGVRGMHAVTAEGSRNNRFYESCGFERVGRAEWNGKALAFFGRRLEAGRHLSHPAGLG